MSGENNIEKAYIIGCTGFGDSCRKECLISGMDDYLNKPVNINELTSKIKRRIEIYNLH
jgi:response regulator RpfG family c-di-GMP phosphodiesterase